MNIFSRAAGRAAPTEPSPATSSAPIGVSPSVFATAIEQLHDGVLVIGKDRRVAAFNQRYIEMFRLEDGGIAVGDRIEDVMRHVGLRGGFGITGQALEAEIARRVALWGSDSTRHERRVYVDGRVIDIVRSPTEDGGVVAVHIDMTDRLAGEAALERQRAHMVSILANITDGVCLMDADGAYTAFNERFLELYGVPRDKVHWGIPFRELAQHFADLDGLSPERRAAEIEHRFRFATDPSQTRIHRQLFSGATLEINKAHLPEGGCVLTISDITESLRQRRALEEERVRVQEASRHQSRFLARMSHEMRTPLNGILGIAALLERTELDARQEGYTSVIRESGSVLLRLIDDLLDATRIESGEFELTAAPFAVCEVMREAIATLEPEAHAKGLTLEKSPSAVPVPKLIGDAVRVKQVVLNLLANAIKFTERGSVGIGLDATLDDSTAQIAISVSDTGIGIAEEDRSQIFRQFFQADDRENRRFGGLGLGLTICDELVRRMGGRIEVLSEQGHGSRFVVHLSLPRAPETMPPP
ncbi:MAG: PAS-domain containing protein [Pseudomonadota bacterium]